MLYGRKRARAAAEYYLKRTSPLGPLDELPGTWSNFGSMEDPETGQIINFNGFGWNLIALPFGAGKFKYRVLMNQYNEDLVFDQMDFPVPNRGLDGSDDPTSGDQTIAATGYEQTIHQLGVADSPSTSDKIRGLSGDGIHHEHGMFLHILDKQTDDLNIARLGTIPHGNSILIMGKSGVETGTPTIPPMSAQPVGLAPEVNFNDEKASPYLDPYFTFINDPFFGTVPKDTPGFPGFNPKDTTELLRVNPIMKFVKKSTVLPFSTSNGTSNIVNTPFIVEQADATIMNATFWIHELDVGGQTEYALQYAQFIMLEFFPRTDGVEGRIQWPHISINTLLKTA